MAEVVYLLCAIASLACAALLLWNWRRSRLRLVLWTGLCFVGLAAQNALLFLDLVVVPDVGLQLVRNLTGLLALGILLYGLITEGP